MPVMDGFQATRALREREQAEGGHLPVIALTANAVSGDRQLCLEAGMDDYVAKPFSQDQLQAVLQRWLPVACEVLNSGAAPAASPAAPMPEAGRPPLPVTGAPAPAAACATAGAPPSGRLDAAAIDVLRNLRPGLLVKVVDAWLQESPLLMQELQNAVLQQDAALLHRAAHALKNSAANVGASDLKQGCSELEAHGRTGDMAGVPALVAEVQQRFLAVQHELLRLREGEPP